MRLFITDDLSLYNNDNSPLKLLYQNCYFKESKGFDRDIIERINYSNNDVNYRAANIMYPEIEALIDKLNPYDLQANRYIQTRNKHDQAFTLLYPFAIKYLLTKNELLLTIKSLLEEEKELTIDEVNINLSDDYKLAASELKSYERFKKVSIQFREEKVSFKTKLIKLLKNSLYEFYHLCYSIYFSLNKPETKGKRHILLVMYDSDADFKLLETFFELIKDNASYHLSIIQVESGIKKQFTISAKHLECKNISVYKFQSFRKGNFISNNAFYDALEKVNNVYKFFRKKDHFKEFDLHYEWMNNAMNKLRPDVCVQYKHDNMGRILSDVSRYHKVPSVCFEYALTFDGPFLKQNIHFTARACINESTATNYKKNHDPTNLYPVIGFIKLDSLSKVNIDKDKFFKENDFDLNQKTILFASTWSSENKIFDEEKIAILKDLSELCYKNNWNLIIKKHPSEFDLVVNDLFNKNPVKNQKIFNHSELGLAEALLMSDFFCCQSSSAVLEAIYFGKPICFLSKAKEVSVASYLVVSNEDTIPTFNDSITFESYLKSIFDTTNNKLAGKTNIELQTKYLYKTDGLASKRLLDILSNIKFIG